MTLARLEAPLVVASDIHLADLSDQRGRLLMDTVARLGASVEYFVLNGDIFDFCFGGSRYFRDKFAPLGQALGALAARGIRVIFVEGNHEFHLEAMGWAGVTVVTRQDYVLTLGSGERIKLSHGDLITEDPLYRAFRALIKSRLAYWCAAKVPGAWLDAYAMRHAKVSRAQDRYRRLDHERVLAAAERWLGDGRYDHGIFGHFHAPYAERRRQGSGMILSVESWDRPNLLAYGSQGFQRAYLEAPGLPYQWQPVASIFG